MHALHTNSVPANRSVALDTFRGITILVMIFVNELAGVSGVPEWLRHMPADADGMSLADLVFPAFLFIVGMALPFSLEQRRLVGGKGESGWQLQSHIISRALALISLGVFMVSAESGYHQGSMLISIHLWALLVYLSALLFWKVYRSQNKLLITGLRSAGLLGLLILAILYRGGVDGNQMIEPQWWGILGLIGWAFLIASFLFQLAQQKIWLLLCMVAICLLYFFLAHALLPNDSVFIGILLSQSGHFSHSAIVLCGSVLSLILLRKAGGEASARCLAKAFMFVAVLAALGLLARDYFPISKIQATPSWSLLSAALCTLIFTGLYIVTDLMQLRRWTRFLQPAANNSLLIYLLPFFIYELMAYAQISLPAFLRSGSIGMVWSAGYAVALMAAVSLLNRLGIRLKL